MLDQSAASLHHSRDQPVGTILQSMRASLTTEANFHVISAVQHVQDNFLVPRPQRTLPEIEAQARQLRTGMGLVSSQAERSAASGLLDGAMDTSALTQRLVGFQVEPGPDEEGDAEEAQSVQEYMENLTRKAVNKAMQVIVLSLS